MNNNSTDRIQKVVTLYSERFKSGKLDHKTVGWGSKESQFLRFEVLCRDLELDGKHILDIGCGLGDFIPFLEQKTRGNFRYTGIDIVPDFISQAHQIHNQGNISFILGDIATENLPKADIVILSGALSLRVDDNEALMQQVLKNMFVATKEAVALNFLSTYVDYQQDKNYHFNPETTFSFAKTLSRYVNLFHDYPLYEFTIQIFKSPKKL